MNKKFVLYRISLSIRPSYGARGEEILDLSSFFASIFPLFPRNA